MQLLSSATATLAAGESYVPSPPTTGDTRSKERSDQIGSLKGCTSACYIYWYDHCAQNCVGDRRVVDVFDATAKAGLEQLVRSMAVELSRHHVRVNAIAPGFLMTALSKPLWEDDAKRSWILERVPLARPGTPREFAAAVQMLCSDASSFMTGQTIVIDGGFLAGGDWSVA